MNRRSESTTGTAVGPPGRQVAIFVRGPEGERGLEAEVDVLVDGVHAGSFISGPGHDDATVGVLDSGARIELRVRVGGVLVEPGFAIEKEQHHLVIPVTAARGLRPEARCADGTTGSPCVTCVARGTEVRICV